jgi:predicted hydrocarbon binding protein
MEPSMAETAKDIARRWLPGLIHALDECTTEEQRIRILEQCGRACGEPDLEEVRRIREEARDREHLLRLINERIKWCGDWVWEEGKIRTVCAACGCPLVVEGYLENSPTFCLCSRGWVKSVFTEALGEEVEVDLVQAIGTGDECCEFIVHPRPAGSQRTARHPL